MTALQQFASTLSNQLDEKDRCTGGHAKRVRHYSARIAARLGLAGDELEEIRLGALLHDVGKIGIEDAILKKRAPLNEGEWKRMQKHPEIGTGLVVDAAGDVAPEVLALVAESVRHHHERWDGRGYPAGLAGDEIPRIARIVAVADTYDAMVSTRPYRRGLAPRLAREEIARGRGTQFDPVIVDAFLAEFE